MNELEKMRSGLPADLGSVEIQQSFVHCKKLLARFRTMSSYDRDFRAVLGDLIPGIPASSAIYPPFHCDHGNGIRLGEHVLVNAGCTFLDGGWITIGDHTLIGPDVRIYTPCHPMDHLERRRSSGVTRPVTIGCDCWIGGAAVILPGVSIGDRCIVGAGSVVTRDIPADSVAAGNPARILKRTAK